MPKYNNYFRFLVEEIHTTIVATVDDDGLPVTAAIDMMDYDEDGLYFLTAKGKSFYDRLTKRGFLALTAIKGEDTLSSVAVSVRGKVRELGFDKIPELSKRILTCRRATLSRMPASAAAAVRLSARSSASIPAISRI